MLSSSLPSLKVAVSKFLVSKQAQPIHSDRNLPPERLRPSWTCRIPEFSVAPATAVTRTRYRRKGIYPACKADVFICMQQLYIPVPAGDRYIILSSFFPSEPAMGKFRSLETGCDKERMKGEGKGAKVALDSRVEQRAKGRTCLRTRTERSRFKMPPTTGHTPLSRCLQRICLRARMRPQSFFGGCFACRAAVYIRGRNKRLLRFFPGRDKTRAFRPPPSPRLNVTMLVKQRRRFFSSRNFWHLLSHAQPTTAHSHTGTVQCRRSSRIPGWGDETGRYICGRMCQV